MKCTEIEKQINSYVDDELNPSLTDKVETHLKECHACEETFESLQTLRQILEKDISVPASSKLDGRVMQAFARHHETKQRKKWQAVIFGQIVIPKPAFAVALLLFVLFAGLAFQFGKMTATKTQSDVQVAEAANQLQRIPEPNISSNPIEESKNNTSEAPVIKYIEVPIVKEKIVTRVVYINKQPRKENSIKDSSAKSNPDNFALNSSVNENKYSTQINLKEFQPVAEMKVKITKKDENYEK